MLAGSWARSASRRGERALIVVPPHVEHGYVEVSGPGGATLADEKIVISVSLMNCGPSIAQDVAVARAEPRWPTTGWRSKIHSRLSPKYPRLSRAFESAWTQAVKSDKIRVLVPDQVEENVDLGVHFGDGILAIEVRWTDLSRRRWSTFQVQDPQGLTRSPRRLRKHWWEWWWQRKDW